MWVIALQRKSILALIGLLNSISITTRSSGPRSTIDVRDLLVRHPGEAPLRNIRAMSDGLTQSCLDGDGFPAMPHVALGLWRLSIID